MVITLIRGKGAVQVHFTFIQVQQCTLTYPQNETFKVSCKVFPLKGRLHIYRFRKFMFNTRQLLSVSTTLWTKGIWCNYVLQPGSKSWAPDFTFSKLQLL